jgi:hypothetical protein
MLGCSPYVLSSSIWLTTDNLASLALLLAAAASLSIADGSARMPIRVGLIASAWATFAVLIRQILIYAAAFPGAAVVARACAQRRMPAPGALFLAGMTLLPAFLVVLAFVALWGGLVPPSFREYHGGGANPVTPVYVLALVAIWGMAAFVTIPGFVRELCTTRMAFLGVLAAMVACIVPSSSAAFFGPLRANFPHRLIDRFSSLCSQDSEPLRSAPISDCGHGVQTSLVVASASSHCSYSWA